MSTARKCSGRGETGDPAAMSVYSQAAMRIWVDLTNSPHVLVLRPVIEREFRKAGRGLLGDQGEGK